MSASQRRLLSPTADSSSVTVSHHPGAVQTPDMQSPDGDDPAFSLPPPGPAKLPWRKVFAFGLGHILNDLCATCWFSYLLVFLHKVLLFESWKAGMVLLSGQLADAAATPLVGIYSDKSKGLTWGSFYFGRRHLWYTIGTVLVLINFFFLFARCVICDILGGGDEESDSDASFVYYSVAAALFNVGWAAVQVAHMALVPELTADTMTRIKLNSVRYAGTVVSSLFVFALLGALVHLAPLGKEAQFHTLAYVCLGVGILTSIIFLLGTEEPRPKELQAAHDAKMRRRRAGSKAAIAAHAHAQNSYRTLDDEPSSGPLKVEAIGSLSSATPKRGQPPMDSPSDALDEDMAEEEGANSHYKYGEGSGAGSPSLHDVDAGASAGNDWPGEQTEAAEEPLPRAVSFGAPSAASLLLATSHGPFENTLAAQLYTLPVRFVSYRCWLRQGEYWSCAFIYMCSRLVVNVSQVFLPFFALDVLDFDDVWITILPCVLYVFSMVAAGGIQNATERIGLKLVSVAGFALASAGLAGMFFLPKEDPWCWLVVPCCVLVGLGNGIVMVAASQLTSDLIGSRTNYSAFVFGSFSFTDKLSNGIVLFLLQAYNDDSPTYVRWAIAATPIASAIAGVLVLLFKVDLAEWKRKHTLPCPDEEQQQQQGKGKEGARTEPEFEVATE